MNKNNGYHNNNNNYNNYNKAGYNKKPKTDVYIKKT